MAWRLRPSSLYLVFIHRQLLSSYCPAHASGGREKVDGGQGDKMEGGRKDLDRGLRHECVWPCPSSALL